MIWLKICEDSEKVNWGLLEALDLESGGYPRPRRTLEFFQWLDGWRRGLGHGSPPIGCSHPQNLDARDLGSIRCHLRPHHQLHHHHRRPDNPHRHQLVLLPAPVWRRDLGLGWEWATPTVPQFQPLFSSTHYIPRIFRHFPYFVIFTPIFCNFCKISLFHIILSTTEGVLHIVKVWGTASLMGKSEQLIKEGLSNKRLQWMAFGVSCTSSGTNMVLLSYFSGTIVRQKTSMNGA